MPRTFLAVLLSVIVVTPAVAQNSLAGVWKVSYPAGTRVENGEQSPIMGTGKLQIEARGDSLIAQFQADPAPDLPARGPVRLSGVAGPGPVALIVHQTTFVEVNGTQRPIGFTSTWMLEAKGDSLTGTLSHHVDDPTVSAQNPGPVRGLRQRP